MSVKGKGNTKTRRAGATKKLTTSSTPATVITDAARLDNLIKGEMWARILAHPDTPADFKRNFDAIFCDLILDAAGIEYSHPEVVRALWPLAVEKANETQPLAASYGHQCPQTLFECATDNHLAIVTEAFNAAYAMHDPKGGKQ